MSATRPIRNFAPKAAATPLIASMSGLMTLEMTQLTGPANADLMPDQTCPSTPTAPRNRDSTAVNRPEKMSLMPSDMPCVSPLSSEDRNFQMPSSVLTKPEIVPTTVSTRMPTIFMISSPHLSQIHWIAAVTPLMMNSTTDMASLMMFATEPHSFCSLG